MEHGVYAQKVTGLMRRATWREKEEIAGELDAHVADHAQALAGEGMTLREAEARAEAAMGDPYETARALDAQLSAFWLWVGRALRGCLAVLGVMAAAYFLADWKGVYANLVARWGTGLYDVESRYRRKEGYTAAEVDVRVELGSGDVLRIYRVHFSPEEGLADVEACRYDRDPFGQAALGWTSQLWARNDQGEWQTWGVSSGTVYDPVWYMTVVGLPVEPGADHLELEYRTCGENVRFQVPLREEVGG